MLNETEFKIIPLILAKASTKEATGFPFDPIEFKVTETDVEATTPTISPF